MKRTFRDILIGVLFMGVAVLAPATGAGQIADPAAPPDPLLDALMADLDVQQIDILRSWNSNIPLAARQRIARLDGFANVSQAQPAATSWMDEFNRGAHGALAAIKLTVNSPPTAQQFVQLWNQAAPSKRVFLSFTKNDITGAQSARTAFEKAGYVVFTFINQPGQNPSYSADITGELFATAGHRLVLDSPDARTSVGVLYEARIEAQISGRVRTSGRDSAIRAKVEIYGRPGCARTIDALKYMKSRSVDAMLRDVDKSPANMRKVSQSELSLLPLIEVNGQKVDYDLRAIDVALRRAGLGVPATPAATPSSPSSPPTPSSLPAPMPGGAAPQKSVGCEALLTQGKP